MLGLGGSAVLTAIVLFAPESPRYASRVEREPAPGEREPIESAKAPEELLATYRAERARYRDIDYSTLEKELAVEKKSDPALGFDPEQALFYDRIASELALDPGEKDLYRKSGLVSVDHVQRYSMGSAYYAIYARDLPVFVTSDSVLHALHRSYDDLLKRLESKLFLPALSEALELTHAELERLAPELGPGLRDSARDVDVYLSVARSLLEGRDCPLRDRSRAVSSIASRSSPGPARDPRRGSTRMTRLKHCSAGSPPKRLEIPTHRSSFTAGEEASISRSSGRAGTTPRAESSSATFAR